MYRNCKCVVDRLQNKAVRVLNLILDYHQGSESSIVGGSGGALKKKVTKNGAWEEKKTVALMHTRASGAISGEL